MNETSTPSVSEAEVRTAKASGYLQQLCKHFGHRIPVSFDADRGRIEFEKGVCELDAARAPEILHMRVSAESPEARARLEEVVGSHLVRFAFREEMRVDWTPA